MSIVGFDIGNETCFVAIVKSGGIEVLDNECSLRATPSYIGFTEKCREIGIPAKTKIASNVQNTIFGFKTLLGKTLCAVSNDLTYLPFDVCKSSSGKLGIKVKYLNKESIFSVHQIMAMMLTKLKSIAETKLCIPVRECVISVPMYYTDHQRRAMLEAAEVSGLKVLKLMNEPTAVALFYGYYKQSEFDVAKTIVFVDLGQSALTVSACEFSNDGLHMLASISNKTVGGRDFDNVLAIHFSEEFKTQYQLDVLLNRKATMLLMLECEVLKKQMSLSNRDLELNIECLMDDVDVKGKMNRKMFEKLSAHLLEGIKNTMIEFLSYNCLENKEIHEVQMIGGSCRLPALKSIIVEVFGQEPISTLNQDESVARGSALQCALMSPNLKTKEYVIEDIQPRSISIVCLQPNMEEKIIVFPMFDRCPMSSVVTFAYNAPFSLKVFYSDAPEEEIALYSVSEAPPTVSDSNRTADELNTLLSILSNTEDWLYDSADYSEKEYKQKMEELTKAFNPILTWHFELEETKKSLQELRKYLDCVSSLIDKFSTNKNYSCKDLEKLLIQKNKNFDTYSIILNNIDNYKNTIPLRADLILQDVKQLQEAFENLMNSNLKSINTREKDNTDEEMQT